MTTSTRRCLRRTLTGLAVPVLAAGLSGCIKMEMELSVADETVSGPMIVAVSKEMLAFAQQFDENADPDELLDEMEAEFDDSIEGVTPEPYEDDSFIGTRYVLDRVPLAELNGSFSEDGDPDALQIVYHADSDTYEVTGAMDLSEAETDLEGEEDFLPPGMLQAMMSSFEMRIAFTFPGEVLEATGDVSGTTVTWTPVMGERTELHAVARASGAGGQPAAPAAGEDAGALPGDRASSEGSTSALTAVLVGLGALVVLGAVGVGIWLMRRGGAPAPAYPQAPAATPGPPTQPTPDQAPTATLPEPGPPAPPPGGPPRP